MANNPGTFNGMNSENLAGIDEIVQNSRTRATLSNPLGVNYIQGSGAPTSITAASTVVLTATNILTGIIVVSPTSATGAVQIDTAANLVTSVNAISAGAVIGDYVQFLLVNGSSASTMTITAGAGGTWDTNQVAGARQVTGGNSKYVWLRLTNVTATGESYVIYA